MITRPMLAVPMKSLLEVHYPVLATPKIDGIRCLKVKGKALSRNFKPIPNHYIRFAVEEMCPNGVDGELVVVGEDFHSASGSIRSFKGEPNFRFLIFDYVSEHISLTYKTRVEQLSELDLPYFATSLVPTLISRPDELITYEQKCISEGYEGVCFRQPSSPYKCGRSTWNEQWLVKWKRYLDVEVKIVGFKELMHNLNEASNSELGFLVRSTHKENLVPGNTLGKLIVENAEGKQYSVGSGFTSTQREEIWLNQEKYLHQFITVRYLPHGTKDLPRHPVFKGFRWDNQN